jgi:hypothetical protein
MRLRGTFVVAALAATQLCGAFGQQAVSTSSTRSSSGINLAFDAQSGQMSASGYTVRSAAAPASGATTTTGTVNLVITINLVSKPAFSPQIPCAAIVIGGAFDLSTPIIDGGIDTVSNNAVVDLKAKTATCMLSIPYEWTLPPDASASEALFLGFAAASVEHDADHHRDVTRRSTIQVAGPLPLPPSGTTTTLAFATSL